MTSTTVRQLTCQSAVNIRWCLRCCCWEISLVSGSWMNTSFFPCCGLLSVMWWLFLMKMIYSKQGSKDVFYSFISRQSESHWTGVSGISNFIFVASTMLHLHGLGTDNMNQVAELLAKTRHLIWSEDDGVQFNAQFSCFWSTFFSRKNIINRMWTATSKKYEIINHNVWISFAFELSSTVPESVERERGKDV